jgi:hypothetical protein
VPNDDASESFEEAIDEVEDALEARFGENVKVCYTFPDRVIFKVCQPKPVPMYPGMGDDDDEEDDDEEDAPLFSVTYTTGDNDQITFGTPQPVVQDAPTFSPAPAGTPALDSAVALMYGGHGASGAVPDGKTKLPASVKKLDPKTQRQWIDVWNSAYRRAKAQGKSDADAEAAAFAQANGTVKADDSTPADWYAQVDSSVNVAFRLADTRGAVPVWQPVHVIGKWSIPHGVSGPIQFTRAMGESFIRNFKANVLRRRVPLDERHLTEQNGVALAWLEELRWGQEGEGLPGAPEPSGHGDILYGRWDYNQLGVQRLSDRNYLYFSPQYSLNYQDKQVGTEYGPTLLAVAGTNDPFIRNMRDSQGNPAMPWVSPAGIAAHDVVILTEGLRPYRPSQEGAMTQQQQTGTDVQLAERMRVLEVQLADEKRAREATEATLAEERRVRYLADCDAFIDSQVRLGVPPGSLHKFRTLLKRLNPSAQAVVTLSDDQGAKQLTLADAIRECIGEMAAINLSAKTYQTDVRPKEQIELDEQVFKVEDAEAKRLVAELYPERVHRNGNGTY